VTEIATVLRHDLWLVGIDLRKNCIGAPGFVEIEAMLRTNKALLYVDLRGNSNVESYEFPARILERLRTNITGYKRQSRELYNPVFAQKLLEVS
jgi:hypothetical protein